MFNQTSHRGKKWVLSPPVCDQKIKHLKQIKPHWPESLIRHIVARDIQVDATLRNILPDPDTVMDMTRAIERLAHAIIKGERIMIYGDYDVDGTSAAALLRRYLYQAYGKDVPVYVPHRVQEGYGPNAQALERIAATGVTCLVMVDCGTNAVGPMCEATQVMSILVIDHHKVQGPQPMVEALVNPYRDEHASSDLRNLCACGLVFLFLIGLKRRLNKMVTCQDVDLRQYLDVVALATVCDVMPLVGLNRVLVRLGLEVLNRRRHAGLAALCSVAGLKHDQELTAYHLGYVLGPRINAVGRMDHALPAVELLTGLLSMEELELCAHTLQSFNEQRQVQELVMLEEATHRIGDTSDAILILDGPWHVGLIGIVAGRLKERFEKPVCVIAWQGDVGKGSGRSVPGFDLGNIIHRAIQQGILAKGGGHAMAVGFEMSPEQLEPLKRFVVTCDPPQHIDAQVRIDEVLTISAINAQLLQQWKILEPFGHGNVAPRIAVADVRLAFASIVGGKHVRMRWVDESGGVLQSIAWNIANEPLGRFLLQQYKHRPMCHIMGRVQWNDYHHGAQLVLQDLITRGV